MNLSNGYQVADSGNLPQVNYIMLLQYMQENECYNAAEMRSAKALLASREGYVDTAVGYVEVKREGNLCITNCRVTPEHKIKGKLYHVTATIDENEEKIISVECNDCAASAGGCKHAICFAIWLIKRTDEPSVTSTVCYWSKPKLARAINDKQFIMARHMGKRKRIPGVNMNLTLAMFSEECKKHKTTSGMLLKYTSCPSQSLLRCFSVFNLMLQFLHEGNSDDSYDSFKLFCQAKISINSINEINQATKDQADSKLWHSLRQGRVTGSKVHDAVHCKTENGSLVQTVLGGYKVPETKAMKRGKVLERPVLQELESELGEKIERSGFILITPIVGVSPDGVCEDFVIEIKCPTSEKAIGNFVINNNLRNKFKAQLMLQMHAMQKSKGLFCVADPSFEQTKIIHKYWVEYDKSYTESLINGAEEFWKKYIFKNIFDSAK